MQFLLIDDMQEHNLSEINRLESLIKMEKNSRESIDKVLKETNKTVCTLGETIRNIVSVGADVVPNDMGRDRSWAVVCIEGKYNIVKFIDLYGEDHRRIIDFLRQYEGSRIVVDAPPITMFRNVFKMK